MTNMKIKYFVFGLVTGGLIIFLYLTGINKTQEESTGKIINNIDPNLWNWPDSLDALVAASEYHKLIFEDSVFRILEVIIAPGQLDPIHTHKGKSIIWIVNNSPIVYKTFGLDDNSKLVLVKQDTINIKIEDLNKGVWENPEPPHSVENIGKNIFKLYRIEYRDTSR